MADLADQIGTNAKDALQNTVPAVQHARVRMMKEWDREVVPAVEDGMGHVMKEWEDEVAPKVKGAMEHVMREWDDEVVPTVRDGMEHVMLEWNDEVAPTVMAGLKHVMIEWDSVGTTMTTGMDSTKAALQDAAEWTTAAATDAVTVGANWGWDAIEESNNAMVEAGEHLQDVTNVIQYQAQDAERFAEGATKRTKEAMSDLEENAGEFVADVTERASDAALDAKDMTLDAVAVLNGVDINDWVTLVNYVVLIHIMLGIVAASVLGIVVHQVMRVKKARAAAAMQDGGTGALVPLAATKKASIGANVAECFTEWVGKQGLGDYLAEARVLEWLEEADPTTTMGEAVAKYNAFVAEAEMEETLGEKEKEQEKQGELEENEVEDEEENEVDGEEEVEEEIEETEEGIEEEVDIIDSLQSLNQKKDVSTSYLHGDNSVDTTYPSESHSLSEDQCNEFENPPTAPYYLGDSAPWDGTDLSFSPRCKFVTPATKGIGA